METAAIRRATRQEMERVGDLIGAAFDDDPVANLCVRQDHRRSEAVRRLLLTVAREIYFPHGAVYLNADDTGTIIWMDSRIDREFGTWQTVRLLPSMVAVAGWLGMRRLMAVPAFVDQFHPTERHYYLYAIATRPDLQGRGIGSALMEQMTRQCDEEGVPGYLENSREKNLPFYRRHGFEVTQEVQFPNGGPPMWMMWREPVR